MANRLNLSQAQSSPVKPNKGLSSIHYNLPLASRPSGAELTESSGSLQLDPLEHFHRAVSVAARAVEEPAVLRVRLVIDGLVFAVGMIGRAAGADHVVGGFVHVRVNARGQRGMHRRAEGADLFAGGDLDRTAGDIRVNLEQQRTAVSKPAAGIKFVDGDSLAGEGVDDLARAEGGGLDERAVNLVRARAEGRAEEQPAEVGIHEHGAAAVPPVERQQSALARMNLRGALFKEFVNGPAGFLRFGVNGFGRGVRDVPGEQMAYAGLARLVAPIAGVHVDGDAPAHLVAFRARVADDPPTGAVAEDRLELAGTSHP